jgi:cobalamin biosynthesis protein CobT
MNDVTFAKMLSSVMLDNKYDRFVKNRRTGKLDTRSLYKVNTSSRLFKKREARKNKHYAVSLVVDCSGSMNGEQIKIAASAAQKLSHHLAAMDIPHNIISFNAHAKEMKVFGPKEQLGVEKAIVNSVSGTGIVKEYEYIFWDTSKKIKSKDGKRMFYPFDTITGGGLTGAKEYKNESKGVGSLFTVPAPAYNADGEAIRFAREKLMRQEGKRLMIHLSDGQPANMYDSYESVNYPGTCNDDYDLKKEVEITLAQGIELYSIGILSSAVSNYYPPKRTGTITKLDQLYPHIIKLIRMNLKRG